MAKRDNHYEVAFGAFLRCRGIPYVAVDETRRSVAGQQPLKSVDYIVSPPGLDLSWLVDVKGRRFPSGTQYWRNWCTAEELQSLSGWETLFGNRFAALLVFAYEVTGELAPLPAEQLFEHGGALYGFVGIRLDHYASFARQLSARWKTVTVPTAKFRALARPAESFFLPGADRPRMPEAATHPGSLSG